MTSTGPNVSAPDEALPTAFPREPNESQSAALPPAHDSGATRMLAFLLRQTYFLDLHDKASGDPAWRRNLCFGLDLAARVVMLAVFVGLIAALAYKAIAPLPAWTH